MVWSPRAILGIVDHVFKVSFLSELCYQVNCKLAYIDVFGGYEWMMMNLYKILLFSA